MIPNEETADLVQLDLSEMRELSIEYLKSFREQLEPHFNADTSNDFEGYRGGSHGHCVMVSMLLHALFDAEYVSTKLEETSHWFSRFRTEDGKAFDVDLTGDQFGHEKIRVKPAGELYPDVRVRTFDDINHETRVRFAQFVNRIDLEKIVQMKQEQ